MFSNIIIAASYRHKNNEPLTSRILYDALRIVIEQHPALYLTSLLRPSSKKEGNHRGWNGRLKNIDLEGCTTFLDNYDDSELGIQALFQKTHNEWFDLEDSTRPLWRLIIVNHVHVLFVWQHLVCDGKGGIAFHKSLLAALNKVAGEGNLATVTSNIVKTSTKPLSTDAAVQYKESGYKPSIVLTIYKVIGLILFRLWYGQRNMFFSDAVYSKKVPVLGQAKKEDRCVTSIQGFRLSPTTLKNCLVACKKNQATFTSLLATVVDITLATDVYPLSKARILIRQIDLRRYLPQTDNMVNMSSAIGRVSRVNKYREVDGELLPNSSRFWDLAREDSAWLHAHLSEAKGKTPEPIRDSLIPTPEDEEPFASQIMPNISIAAEGSYAISNLGAVDRNFDHVEGHGSWELGAIEFSCCATAPCVGSLFYFAVLSLKGGGCAVNVSYEKGVLPDEKIQSILEKVKQRMTSIS